MSARGVYRTYNPPSSGNYYNKIGYVVTMTDANEVTVSTDPTTEKPLGIIVSAIDDTNGPVTVCVSGPCKASADTTITAGTHSHLMASGDGQVTPGASARWLVGWFIGSADGAAGEYVDVNVQPHWYEDN